MNPEIPGEGPPPHLRYGSNVKTGYLQKKGNVFTHNPLFTIHKKHRYLEIDGSTLRCYRKKDQSHQNQLEWEIGLQNANITGNRERLEISIRAWDFHEEFAPETTDEYDEWFTALKDASEKSIKDFYAFTRVLGEGHFGKVLLARDRHTREKFAVKVISKDSREIRSQTLIQRELAILKLVNHTNIVRLYDLFDTPEKLYFVLEYMPGGALYEVLQSKSINFSEHRASLIVKDILHGLAYLHSKGIVHRDVKPENILTSAKEWPFVSKLSDFGLSNFLGTGALESKVGTPYFCAREVVTNETYGTKADLWSLGVVTYEMLSGRKPFEGKHTKSVLYAILDGRYSFPQEIWQYLSTEARDFVSKLICIDVNKRMSAEEALNHPWIANQGTQTPLDPTISRPTPSRQFEADLESPEPMEEDA
ncbi:Serine/threonine-protein kinase [Gracilaria domingensis]|nr:Serine/threonine-protein kinase [Gracilaria domingensis]